MEPLTRSASFAPSTFDPEARTVEAIISTFADVTRKDARGPYIERLDPAGLDLAQLIGAPVLDGHRQGSARDVIGTVASHRSEGGKLLAMIRLSGAPDAAPIVTRIQEGTIKGVSLGYRVSKWVDTIDPRTKARVRTASAWSIHEVSAVPIPADAGATFRNGDKAVADTHEDTQSNLVQTRAEIRTIARAANLSPEWADGQIDAGATVLEARAAAFEEIQRRGSTTPRVRIGQSSEDPTVMQTRRQDALYARMSGEAPKPEAKPFMGETLRDMARASVEAAGTSTRGMDSDQLFRAAMHTTSDFPNLLTGAGNRVLAKSYELSQSPLKQVARQTTVTDFRKKSVIKLSDIGGLEKVTESGEIKSTTRAEVAEGYALETYATMFSISRKALVNDDLGAFGDWGRTAGRMAAETEGTVISNLLLSNPTLQEDGKALFHTDHKNVNLPGWTGNILDEGRRHFRLQLGVDGKTLINALPKFVVVGPSAEMEFEKILAEIYPATADDVNPFASKLSLIVEPRLESSAGGFFMFADPAVLPVLEYAYLASAQGPQIASREGFDVLGMEFRVVLDFGAGAVDYRGAFRNGYTS